MNTQETPKAPEFESLEHQVLWIDFARNSSRAILSFVDSAGVILAAAFPKREHIQPTRGQVLRFLGKTPESEALSPCAVAPGFRVRREYEVKRRL